MSRTLLGRRRHYTRGGGFLATRALNFPVQATTADGLKEALIKLHRALQQHGSNAKIIIVNRDEIVLEVKDELVEEVASLLESCMISGLQSFVPQVPIKVKINIGADWSENHLLT